MHENSLARTVADRARSGPRTPQRPGTTPDGSTPPPLALLVAPALLAVCFR